MNLTSNSGRLRLVRLFAWSACAILAALLAGVLIWRAAVPDRLPGPRYSGEADIRSEFSLVDHTGRPVTQADYADKWQLVFFGYTHCPDVCPTTLAYMASVLEELGESADRVAPLFITVDPVRDTPAVMAEFVSAFDPRLIGLTGTEAQVSDAMHAFRAWAEKVEDPSAPDGYSMSHPGYIYLMRPGGRFVEVFQEQEQRPEEMAAEILDHMKEEE